jgi:hypothetical protein
MINICTIRLPIASIAAPATIGQSKEEIGKKANFITGCPLKERGLIKV